jgi:hypothetical protein
METKFSVIHIQKNGKRKLWAQHTSNLTDRTWAQHCIEVALKNNPHLKPSQFEIEEVSYDAAARAQQLSAQRIARHLRENRIRMR